MLHGSRSFAFALLVAPLLLAACGSTPDVPNSGQTFTPDSGDSDSGPDSGSGASSNSDDSGVQLNLDGGGESGAANAPDADTGMDSGPTCGDGVVDAPETCDDGNSKPGDGCDGNCQVETNWVCKKPGQACTPAPSAAVCGNGTLEDPETCDLGKTVAGVSKNDGTQGCSATCQTVPGWTCPATGAACTRDAYCGDGMVQSILGEQCDDGTNDGTHGCTATCQVVTGWKCPPTGGACAVDAYCGNGTLDSGEQCDDHNRRSYDGCSSTCFVESGWSCPATGGACSRVCGNGKLDSGETCDDGNFYSGDGCSSTCQLEPNYTCQVVGQPCLFTPPPPPPQCGNGKIEQGETCDDGNVQPGDGCSSTCQLEVGWKCTTVNAPCVAAKCGDGILAGSEQCDDGIVDNKHGCSSTCTIMPNAVCPANGGLCIPMVCGDGKVTGTETCDDGVNDGKHGCSASCQLVNGWACPLAGTPCIPVCGDGLVVGDEQCDEKADVPCCTATCKLKPGFVCDPSKTPHSQPAAGYCGDNIVDGPSNAASPVRGAEQCDDGNTLPFDGCSPTCTNEPLCGTKNTYLASPPTVPFQCFAHCGDGLVLPPEQCDDGNAQDGDGCDHNCKVETIPNTTTPAWTCVQPPPGSTLSLPVVWRDFSPRSHPQFSIDPLVNRRLPGIPQNALQPVAIPGPRQFKYVPAYNTAYMSPAFGGSHTNVANWTMNGPGWVSGSEGYKAPPWMNTPPAYDVVWWSDQPATLTNGNASALLSPAGRFAQWYVDDATVNMTYAGTIDLKQIAGGGFQYACQSGGCDSAFPGNDGFFPLDGKGWVQAGKETARDNGHNFSFTTETRNWFAFKGGEQLAFYGDDDLWVFVNGQLTLDIGGIHSQTAGQFTLASNGVATVCVENLPGDGGSNPAGATPNCSTVNLGLTVGSVYEIAIFNAEREVTQSNFKLTLQGFNSAPSVCTPICGDGYVVGTEQCDRGVNNVPPSGNTYGSCTTDCKLGPYCGDAKPQSPPEVCDNGLNIDSYVNHSPAAQMCAPGCLEPAFCGDGIIQKVDGETCDDGTANNQNTYGHCQTNCKLGARCGDGSIQAGNGETCDDGPNNGAPSSACAVNCQKKCGNGVVDVGEQCDAGTGPTGNGAGSTCDASCKLKCGNGQLDAGEQCDDGKNDGSYGTCKPDCTFAPFCGDKVVQNPPEACDNGTAANVSTAYGANSCTDQCLPGGYCGDGLVNGPEKCDDGKNTGMPGSCTADCSAYVPTIQCGDGTIEPPEKCDDGKGPTGNGTATSKCDTSCRFKCGNGVLDAGEQCDNGVNDGSYGTCNANCTLAGYCGDGVKNGSEQCDNGAKNVAVATAYGVNVCTSACKSAPFCGDGRVQSQFGEQCEGNLLCSACQSTVPK